MNAPHKVAEMERNAHEYRPSENASVSVEWAKHIKKKIEEGKIEQQKLLQMQFSQHQECKKMQASVLELAHWVVQSQEEQKNKVG